MSNVQRLRNEENIDGSKRARELLWPDEGLPPEQQIGLPRFGVVIMDLDLLVRWYGKRYGLDEKGTFALVEIKFGGAPLTQGTLRTIGLLDEILRRGDVERRYLGAFLLYDRPDLSWRFHGGDVVDDDGLIALFDAQLVDVPIYWPRA